MFLFLKWGMPTGLFFVVIGVWLATAAKGQLNDFAASSRFELSETVQLDQADGAIRTRLERIKTLLADRRWEDAVTALRQLMESPEEKLVGVTEHRYVSVQEYCGRQIAALPPEALRIYRGQVDPAAEKWYRQGLAQRDRRLLLKVVEQIFCSRFGDDALLALGDMDFEAGDFDAARWFWERILPHAAPAGGGLGWPGYPDSDLDPAAVRARLVLVSIFDGSIGRAREELAELTRLHRNAHGWLSGREGNYVEILTGILAKNSPLPLGEGQGVRGDFKENNRSSSSPHPNPLPKGEGANWPTFAGDAARNGRCSGVFEAGQSLWRLPLPPVRWHWTPPSAEGNEPLSYYPAVVGGAVFVCGPRAIEGVRLSDGKPLWGGAGPAVYRDVLEGIAPHRPLAAEHFGVPRFTLTIYGEKLFARIGSGMSYSNRPQGETPDYLVGLDLAAQGRLLWKVSPEEGWAFDGAPVADGAGVYAVMRRIDIRPQVYVACFDPQSGEMRWRRFVCSAETPARGRMPECSNRLLTLAGDSIYFNTNLGAAASLAKEDGRVQWISLYPRSRRGDLARLAPHWHRELNPCVYHRGVLYAAPADSPRIIAFDAATGIILWQTGTEVEDAVHLLGATDEHLIASGGRLYWIGLSGADRGRVKHLWPESLERPGYGRGALTDGLAVFPTRDTIYLLDRRTAEVRKSIALGPLGATGGNVLPAGGGLLIATGKELIFLHPKGSTKEREAYEVTEQVTFPRRTVGTR